MNCKNLTHDLFLDYADNALPAPEAQQIKQHLGQCPRCRRLLSEVATISSSFRKTPDLKANRPITPEMDMAVLADIRSISRQVRRRSHGIPWKVTLAYAAAAMIAVVAVLVLQTWSARPRPASSPVADEPQAETSPRVASPVKTDRPPSRVTPTPVETAQTVPGDMNGDRKVDIADAMLLHRALLEQTPAEGADITGDRRVDIGDVQAVTLKTLVPIDKE